MLSVALRVATSKNILHLGNIILRYPKTFPYRKHHFVMLYPQYYIFDLQAATFDLICVNKLIVQFALYKNSLFPYFCLYTSLPQLINS